MLSHHLPANPNLESTQFSSLQLPNLRIRILDKLTPSYYFISQLYLDHNALMTLNGIQQFHNLQILSFNFNQVASFNQLHKIQNKFFLTHLSFIGNPLEADPRARFEVLVDMGFNQLHRLNPIGQTRSARSTHSMRGRKSDNFHRSYEEQQGKTERYTPKFSDIQPKSSRRLFLKTEANEKNPQRPNHFTSIKISHKSHTNNVSTTLNKTHDSPILSIKNRSKLTKIHEDSDQVDIRPFQYVDEDYQVGLQGYQSGKKSQEQLQQSPIKSDRLRTDSIFHETGYFDQSSAYLKSDKYQHRNFVMEFLEQQKMEIAEAFRIRHLKESVFYALARLKYARLLSQTQAKRKGLAAVKFYSILNKII